MNLQELEKLTKIYKPEESSTSLLTKFEITKLIAQRATDIDNGALTTLQTDHIPLSSIDIAFAEFYSGSLPLKINTKQKHKYNFLYREH
jgi:DNA-directed RNA polymerase subunit K/omega